MDTYVWRLVIEYPEGGPKFRLADEEDEDGRRVYRDWPRNRRYLSQSGAQARATVFEELGAKLVRIERSLPIQWPEA